ncbi:MAG: hypothetical protein JOZ51_22110 [Chloroflexi bacterium]|nr:hypothetical protein [Chloroflexota bacterium]
MSTPKNLADLFESQPWQWGLRGDPYLWRDMQAHLAEHAYPPTEAVFMSLLEQTYQQLTGVPLTNREPLFIERYSHGGMSSGYISPQFWSDTAFPLLRSRYLYLT